MSNVKYMDLEEFRSLGFLQEANRQFFHPHGLALELTVVDEHFHQRLIDVMTAVGMSPSDAKMAAEILFPLDSEHLSGIWDYRDDPEGMRFEWRTEEEKAEAVRKALNVSDEWLDHVKARIQFWGATTQPYPGEFEDED